MRRRQHLKKLRKNKARKYSDREMKEAENGLRKAARRREATGRQRIHHLDVADNKAVGLSSSDDNEAFMDTPELVGVEDVGKRLGLSRQRVYSLAREGLLPCIRLGRSVRFDPMVVEAFLRNGGRGWEEGWKRS